MISTLLLAATVRGNSGSGGWGGSGGGWGGSGSGAGWGNSSGSGHDGGHGHDDGSGHDGHGSGSGSDAPLECDWEHEKQCYPMEGESYCVGMHDGCDCSREGHGYVECESMGYKWCQDPMWGECPPNCGDTEMLCYNEGNEFCHPEGEEGCPCGEGQQKCGGKHGYCQDEAQECPFECDYSIEQKCMDSEQNEFCVLYEHGCPCQPEEHKCHGEGGYSWCQHMDDRCPVNCSPEEELCWDHIANEDFCMHKNDYGCPDIHEVNAWHGVTGSGAGDSSGSGDWIGSGGDGEWCGPDETLCYSDHGNGFFCTIEEACPLECDWNNEIECFDPVEGTYYCTHWMNDCPALPANCDDNQHTCKDHSTGEEWCQWDPCTPKCGEEEKMCFNQMTQTEYCVFHEDHCMDEDPMTGEHNDHYHNHPQQLDELEHQNEEMLDRVGEMQSHLEEIEAKMDSFGNAWTQHHYGMDVHQVLMPGGV